MSLDEMEQTWNEQQLPSDPAAKPVQKAANSLSRTLLLAWAMLAVMVFALALKVHEVWVEPERTFANSFWNLSIAAASVACGGFGVVWARRFVSEFRTLAHDTVRCLDLLIYNVEWEIRSIRRDLPLMMLGFLILFVLAKGQSISAGFESSVEWNYIWFVLVVFGITGAVMYHRVQAFLRPRLEELRAVRRQFDPTP